MVFFKQMLDQSGLSSETSCRSMQNTLVNEGKLDGAAWQPWHAMAGIAMGCYGAGGYVGVVKFDHGIQ